MTASMEHYIDDYLSSSGNLLWYANGNMALRHALIALAGADGFSSRPTAVIPTRCRCAPNGMNPCNGFDPHYTMLRLQDALTGHALSDDPQWLRLANVETNQLMSLTDKSTWMLNASNGSRDTIPAERLDPQVLGVFDEHNIRADLSPATNCPPQAQSMSQLFNYYRTPSNPGLDVYSLSLAGHPAR